uniref:Ribosome assembly factor mrt4 n=1 Tax=Strigamia maritima TaxID=126957 RepID=T1ITR9_STRMM
MPKSKRDKKVSLTQVKRKPLETKQQLVQDVRSCAEQYARVFVISTENVRNNKLKDVRQEWKHSRFFFGKNKVMALALGKSDADECQNEIHHISKHLVNQRGLLFTNKTKDEVLKWFAEFKEPDYARSGNKALETIVLDKGPLPTLSFSLEPQLRQLGLPTSLQRGVITLTKDYELCKKDAELTPEQARLLKLLSKKMSDFKVNVICMWSNDGSFEVFKTQDEDENQNMEESDEES